MRIAITGASGFIGRHVVYELLRQSIELTVVVRDSSSLLVSSASYDTVCIDVTNPPSNAFDMMGEPDVLIHLAWGGLSNYMSLMHFEEELPAHYLFLRSLIKSGLKHLIVAGTCLEYGMQSGRLNEEITPKPICPYGFAKDSLRRQLEYLMKEHPFSMTWPRLFYLYGEGQASGSLYSQLRQAAGRNDAVFNMSGGEQLRDYLSVREAASHIVMLAMSGHDNGIVNVCSGKPISVRSLVEGWVRDNNWPIKLNLGYYPYPEYEPMAFWGDRKKLDRCLKKQ